MALELKTQLNLSARERAKIIYKGGKLLTYSLTALTSDNIREREGVVSWFDFNQVLLKTKTQVKALELKGIRLTSREREKDKNKRMLLHGRDLALSRATSEQVLLQLSTAFGSDRIESAAIISASYPFDY